MATGQSVRRVDGGKIPGPSNVPGVIEVRMDIALSATKMSHSFIHGSYVTIPPNLQTLATQLFGSISSAWGTNLGPLMAAATTFQAVQVRDMSSYLNPVYTGTGTAVPGSSPDPAMPADVAAALTKNIASRGRGLKGRLFLSGWATNAGSAGGVISGAAQTALNNFGAALMTALTNQSLTACVPQVARQDYIGLTGTTHPARAANKVSITSIVLRDTEWDTQRRRGG